MTTKINIRSRSPRGFWRCGVQFTPAGQDFAEGDFDAKQWKRLRAEPNLAVSEDTGAAKRAAAAEEKKAAAEKAAAEKAAAEKAAADAKEETRSESQSKKPETEKPASAKPKRGRKAKAT